VHVDFDSGRNPDGVLNELNAIAALVWYMEPISSPCLTSLNAMLWLCCSSMYMGMDLMSPEYFGPLAVSAGLLVYRSGFLPRILGWR